MKLNLRLYFSVLLCVFVVQLRSPTLSSEQISIEKEEAEEHRHQYLRYDQEQFWVNVLIAIVCTITGAFCSGMTVGLLSISKMQLQLMMEKPDGVERQMAVRISNLVNDHHLFLVTLLIANAIALESLPIILHSLMPDWTAILFSTFVVLVVAEIVPQAYCTGSKKLILAFYATPIINVMIKVFFVLAWPIAKGLDHLLGVHDHERIPHKDFATFLNQNDVLTPTEKMLLTDTLDLRTQKVHSIMLPIHKAFMIDVSKPLTQPTLHQIAEKDYTYVFAYKEDRTNVIGMIKIKEFAILHLGSLTDIDLSQLIHPKIDLLTVYADTNLLEMLMLFETRHAQVALVCKEKKKINPNILSVYYSKKDMIYQQNQAQIIGIIFLSQIFNEMGKPNIQQEVKQISFKKKVQQMVPINDSLKQKLLK